MVYLSNMLLKNKRNTITSPTTYSNQKLKKKNEIKNRTEEWTTHCLRTCWIITDICVSVDTVMIH